jgi:transposase
MKVQEVVMKAVSGEITWLRAADILGMSPRTVRRWRYRMEQRGYDGLLDRRRQTPSPKRAPLAEVERVTQLYRAKYQGFNVRHFHQMAVERHGVKLSYSFVKAALQTAGLVKKRKARGRHRLRREPRACFGEMLHIDGSKHAWLALRPGEHQVLVSNVDDATSRILYAQLHESESTWSVMTALRHVVDSHGIPAALYSDRASWAAYTPKAGEPVDKSRRTQVGRALDRLGIEQILAYSPQARGRSERSHGTLQDRLVSELRLEKVRSVEAANRYLRERYVPDHNRRFAREPKDPQNAFVALGRVELDQILCVEEERTVGRDNVVVFGTVRLQVDKQPGRSTCAGRRVLVRQHLDGTHSVWLGGQRLGAYDRRGRQENAA